MNQIKATMELNKLTAKSTPNYISRKSISFRTALAAIENPGVPQVTGKNKGRGQHAGSMTWLNPTIAILMRIGVKYQVTNVAPKGGRHGDRITVIFDEN